MSENGTIERFYPLAKVADMMGIEQKELNKQVREGAYDVETYRWASGGDRVYVTQDDAQEILEASGSEPIYERAPERKTAYGVPEVADILGLTRMSVFNLAKNRLKNHDTIPMVQVDETKFGVGVLREWFGRPVVERAGLDGRSDNRRAYTIEEVSEALGISKRKIRKMMDEGLRTVKSGNLTVRFVISHDDLVKWIETRKETNDREKVEA